MDSDAAQLIMARRPDLHIKGRIIPFMIYTSVATIIPDVSGPPGADDGDIGQAADNSGCEKHGGLTDGHQTMVERLAGLWGLVRRCYRRKINL